MSIVTINVPDEVIYNLYNSEKEFVDYVRMTIAKELYRNKGVCLVYCAEIVEMTEQEFAKLVEESKAFT